MFSSVIIKLLETFVIFKIKTKYKKEEEEKERERLALDTYCSTRDNSSGSFLTQMVHQMSNRTAGRKDSALAKFRANCT